MADVKREREKREDDDVRPFGTTWGIRATWNVHVAEKRRLGCPRRLESRRLRATGTNLLGRPGRLRGGLRLHRSPRPRGGRACTTSSTDTSISGGNVKFVPSHSRGASPGRCPAVTPTPLRAAWRSRGPIRCRRPSTLAASARPGYPISPTARPYAVPDHAAYAPLKRPMRWAAASAPEATTPAASGQSRGIKGTARRSFYAKAPVQKRA